MLQSTAPDKVFAAQSHPKAILVELLPLPISALIAAIYLGLGWEYYLLFTALLIGTGIITRGLLKDLEAKHREAAHLALCRRVCRAIAETADDVEGLIALTEQLCTEVAPALGFDLGIYLPEHVLSQKALAPSSPPARPIPLQGQQSNAPKTHVHIPLAVLDEQRRSPMYIPMTSLWQWLSEQRAPLLASGRDEIERLPFELPPLGKGIPTQSAMFVPLPPERPASENCADPVEETRQEAEVNAPPPPLGGLVMQSPHPGAFSPSHLDQIALIAYEIGRALAHAGSRPPPNKDADPVQAR